MIPRKPHRQRSSPLTRGRLRQPAGRRLTAAVVAFTALGLVASTAPSGATSPSDPLPDSVDAEPFRQLGTTSVSAPLTLVTGDRVHVDLADQTPVVRDVTQAPRAEGETVPFYTLTKDTGTYVVPEDALELLSSGLLDWELFNVAKLGRLVADGTIGEVPVIVTHSSPAASRSAPTMAGATVDKALPIIDATSQSIDGDGRWWAQVTGKEAPASRSAGGPLAGVDKVWLNELATVQLEDSVPMVEAPAAWDAGYDGSGITVGVLDTGIDTNHPDVAGLVVAEADFTGNPDGARDGHGHGTHVAATIAGSGAASDGLRPGVAPGADLLVGKVCTDAGSCEFDDVIAGMEWAARSGARVVNMSLGGQPTDGTDVLSMAVNQISEATGTLFVVSAGNSGPGAGTVAAPGAADQALTVGAVNKDREMADFSSRGPRLGDEAVKPDIAAPGVSIVAARAGGTAMGTVVDDHYTAASGTSMAAPHVTGAAAVVAERYPDLNGRQIKALLMGAAVDLGHDLFAQGEGLLDVAGAADRIVATSGPVSFGRLTYPHRVNSKTVTYTNLTDEPVTLSLDTTLDSVSGTPGPDGLATVSPTEVTVPASGTAEAALTIDGRALGEDGLYGRYRGELIATDSTGAVAASDRLTALFEAERHDVNIEIIPPEGATDVDYGEIVVLPVDDQVHLHDDPAVLPAGPFASTALYAGAYDVVTSLRWEDAAGERHNALVTEPEVTVDGAESITFDLREAKPVATELSQPTETYGAVLQHRRTSETGTWSLDATLSASYGTEEPNWWTLPTDPVSEGTFTYVNAQVMLPPLVTMRALGDGRPLDLQPRYATADIAVDGRTEKWGEAADQSRITVPTVPHLPARGIVPVVYAGTGTAGELADAEVDGALVLLTPTDICDERCDYLDLKERVDLAAEHGAAGVIVAGKQGRVDLGRPPTDALQCGDGPEDCPDAEPYSAVPLVSVSAEKAAALTDRLERRAPIRIRFGGDPEVPQVYALSFVEDQVPSDLPHRVTERDLEAVEHRIHGTQPGMLNREGLSWARAMPELSRESEPGLSLPKVATGRTLTMLIGPRRDEALDRFRLGTVYFDEPNVISRPEHLQQRAVWSWPAEIQEVVVDGTTTLTWNSGPLLPATHTGDHTDSGFGTDWGMCAGCREGDVFWPVMYLSRTGGHGDRVLGLVNDTGAGYFLFVGVGCDEPECTITLYDDEGEEIPQQIVPLGYTVGGRAGDGRSPQDIVHQLKNGSAVDSGYEGDGQ